MAASSKLKGVTFSSLALASSGCPNVNVPVLSKITVSISARRSRPSAAFTRIPDLNKRLEATTWTTGTANPSAHGQVIIRTAIALISEASQPTAENKNQPRKVAAAKKCTRGAYILAARSASLTYLARPCSAVSINSIISSSSVLPVVEVISTLSVPLILIVPA